jgi:cytoskeletal protein RodZ
VGGGGDAAGGRDGGAVAQPARIRRTATSIATALAERATREPSKESKERDKMLWFFLEALVALLIAVAIVGWTMGFGRRKSRDKPGDADRDNSP